MTSNHSRIHFRAMAEASAAAPPGLRRIASVEMPNLAFGDGAVRDEPQFDRAAPTDLLVDETYQRNLSEKSLGLVRRIVADWDWARFKPPVCVRTSEGLHVIDGQHTAIAAAMHPMITDIPIMIVKADSAAARAAAFIGHNRDRTAVTAPQLHIASLRAEFPEAILIDRLCSQAGIKILRVPPYNNQYLPGETMAIGTIQSILKRVGEERLAQILMICGRAENAPLTMPILRGVEATLGNPIFRGRFEPDRLGDLLVNDGIRLAKEAAKRKAQAGGTIFIAMSQVLIAEMKRRDWISPGIAADPKPVDEQPRALPVPALRELPTIDLSKSEQDRPNLAKSSQSRPVEAKSAVKVPSVQARPPARRRAAAALSSVRQSHSIDVTLGPVVKDDPTRALVDAAIAEGRLTKCPTAYVGPVEGAITIKSGLTERAIRMHDETHSFRRGAVKKEP